MCTVTGQDMDACCPRARRTGRGRMSSRASVTLRRAADGTGSRGSKQESGTYEGRCSFSSATSASRRRSQWSSLAGARPAAGRTYHRRHRGAHSARRLPAVPRLPVSCLLVSPQKSGDRRSLKRWNEATNQGRAVGRASQPGAAGRAAGHGLGRFGGQRPKLPPPSPVVSRGSSPLLSSTALHRMSGVSGVHPRVQGPRPPQHFSSLLS